MANYPTHLTLLALGLALPLPAMAGTVITRSQEPLARAERVAAASGLPASGLAKAAVPSDGTWIVPYVVDVGNPSGTTTLFSIRSESAPGAIIVGIEVLDDDLQGPEDVDGFLPGQTRTYNLRDLLGAAPPGLARGVVRISPPTGAAVSVDYFVVSPAQDFASGGLGVDYVEEECEEWKVRVLQGGAFSGGTSYLMLLDGPRGDGPGDPPTVVGEVFSEGGAFVNSFEIHTDKWVVEVPAADLVVPEGLFGVIVLSMETSLGGGWVTSEFRAEGRYSVSLPGVCRDSLAGP